MEELFKADEIKKEMINYTNISNSIVGIVFVTLFLGALGTDIPQATAFILLPIAIGALFFMTQNYPPSIKLLQDMSKQETYKSEKQELEKIIKKFQKDNFSWKSLFSTNIIYIYGFSLYSFLLFIPNFGKNIKDGTWVVKLISYIFQ